LRAYRLVFLFTAAIVGTGVLAVPAIDCLRGASLVVRAASLEGRGARWLARFDTAPFRTTDLEVPSRSGPLRARIYRPVRPFSRTVVLTPGVHSEGIDEPRLVKFAGDLAEGGAAVVTPELPDLLGYEITVRLADQIEDVLGWVAADRQLAPDGRVGVVGISFSGGMSVIAAGRPSVRDRVAFVLSFGGHGDLGRTLRFLCTGIQADGTYRKPHDYGLVVMLINFAGRVAPPEQVPPLKAAVGIFMKASHLDMVDHERARGEFERAVAAEASLASPAREYLHDVNTRNVAALGRLMAPVAESLFVPDVVSPERCPVPAAPVFLLHGSDDQVIPAIESERLAVSLRERGADVRLLITPLITHAEVDRPPTAAEAYQLVRFWMLMLRR
jgi:dienelactone hydrolase